ncbi:MAG: hypothetical protein KC680_04780, partial [Candidatus Peregrinibacteria bacterium]|nr:hypothetical protein [Candidatus Peregrinibacteria bacterium]
QRAHLTVCDSLSIGTMLIKETRNFIRQRIFDPQYSMLICQCASHDNFSAKRLAFINSFSVLHTPFEHMDTHDWRKYMLSLFRRDIRDFLMCTLHHIQENSSSDIALSMVCTLSHDLVYRESSCNS